MNLLAQTGDQHPRLTLRSVRDFVRLAGHDPLLYMQSLVANHRLIGIGEMHNVRGREMAAPLVQAAAHAGARLLFLEIHRSEQPALDMFTRTGQLCDLPASVGGGHAQRLLASDVPYIEMLYAARGCDMRLIAIDIADTDEPARDRYMAEMILHHLRAEPNARAVAVVGQLHLLPRPFRFSAYSLVQRVRDALGHDQVAAIGRAVPHERADFSVWPVVVDPSVPTMVGTSMSPFAALPSMVGTMPLLGSDFDALLLYPATASERDSWLAAYREEDDMTSRERALRAASRVASRLFLEDHPDRK